MQNYEEKINQQGINLPLYITMQEMKYKLKPKYFFNACENSKIKNKFLFILNLLILKLELKKNLRTYNKFQQKYYKQMINQG